MNCMNRNQYESVTKFRLCQRVTRRLLWKTCVMWKMLNETVGAILFCSARYWLSKLNDWSWWMDTSGKRPFGRILESFSALWFGNGHCAAISEPFHNVWWNSSRKWKWKWRITYSGGIELIRTGLDWTGSGQMNKFGLLDGGSNEKEKWQHCSETLYSGPLSTRWHGLCSPCCQVAFNSSA